MGTVFHHQYNPLKATYYYKQALIKDSHNPAVYNDIGNAYRRWGKINKKRSNYFFLLAESFYKKSIKLSKNSELKVSPIINLALFYNGVDRLNLAKKYAQKALDIISSTRTQASFRPWVKIAKSIIDSN